MLKKESRATKNDFKLIGKPDKTIQGEFFTARVFGHEGSPLKFAVSISKKVEKKAVLRNKIRRLSYEVVRRMLPDIKNKLKDKFIIHFILKSKPKVFPEDVNQDMNNILNRLIK